MRIGRIGALAATAIAAGTAALIPLSAGTASAAQSGCAAQTFSTSNGGAVNRCVRDEQILLNDLRSIHDKGPNQTLAVDGLYGPGTASDVRAFQGAWGIGVDGITGPQTWGTLCVETFDKNFRGVYWTDAGCPTVPGTLRG